VNTSFPLFGVGSRVIAPPWTTVQAANCRLFWIASGATDSGPAAYTVSTMPDQVGGAALTCTSVTRAAGPATPITISSSGGTIQRSSHASFKAAQANGSWSAVMRLDPGDQYGGTRVSDGTDASGFFCWRDRMRVSRTNSSTVWPWEITHSALASGRYTFGVSFVRSGASCTASFHRNGVLIGTDTDTTRDLTFDSTFEQVQVAGNGNTWAGGAHWSVALSDAEHATVHSYFAAVDP
jgi:hypothetical protein